MENTTLYSRSRWTSEVNSRTILLILVSLGGIAAVVGLLFLDNIRLSITITVGFLLVAMSLVRIQFSIMAMFVFLTVLGDVRRMILPVAEWSGSDPLLLVGPIFAIILFGHGWATRRIKVNTPLAKWTLLLTAIMVLQVFNPRQGGLIVGVAGMIFLLIPLFWFWIGRTYFTKALMKTLLLKVVVPLSIVALLLGLYQTFYGYLPYQMDWYKVAGYSALGTPETGLAPISLFASATEYGNYLIVAMIILWSYGVRRHRGLLLLLPVFFIAVFLTGSRGPVVKVLLVMAGLWGVLGPKKTWVLRGLVALAIGSIGFVWSISNLTPSHEPGTAPSDIQRKMMRQEQVLDGPGQKGSTWRIHGYMMMQGYIDGFREPLGLGLGSVTKAATKFGGYGATTEVDASNVFRATGLFGGVVYHIMIFLIILSAFRYWDRTRTPLALALLGILGVTFLMWLGGGQYAVCPLVWLCVGALDRFENMENPEQES